MLEEYNYARFHTAAAFKCFQTQLRCKHKVGPGNIGHCQQVKVCLKGMSRSAIEASVVQWLCHSPCKPGVAGSISGFSSPSDGTIN